MERYLGIDLGGTKIAMGLFDKNKALLKKIKFPTFNADTPEKFADMLADSIKEFTSDSPTAIGIGIPGIAKDGIIINLPNIPILNGYPLSAMLKEIFGCGVYTDNDANLAALSQYQLLNMNGNMVYITVSTGIGAGIIINGKIFSGDNGAAGEAGHMLTGRGGFKCNCGNEGCYEISASGGNLNLRIGKAVSEGERGMLSDIYREKGTADGKDVYECYLKGDALAARLIKETAEYVGELCYNIYILLNITTFCIGGGLTAWGDAFYEPMQNKFKSLNNMIPGKVSFIKAANSDDAGIRGAVSIAFQK